MQVILPDWVSAESMEELFQYLEEEYPKRECRDSSKQELSRIRKLLWVSELFKIEKLKVFCIRGVIIPNLSVENVVVFLTDAYKMCNVNTPGGGGRDPMWEELYKGASTYLLENLCYLQLHRESKLFETNFEGLIEALEEQSIRKYLWVTEGGDAGFVAKLFEILLQKYKRESASEVFEDINKGISEGWSKYTYSSGEGQKVTNRCQELFWKVGKLDINKQKLSNVFEGKGIKYQLRINEYSDFYQLRIRVDNIYTSKYSAANTKTADETSISHNQPNLTQNTSISRLCEYNKEGRVKCKGYEQLHGGIRNKKNGKNGSRGKEMERNRCRKIGYISGQVVNIRESGIISGTEDHNEQRVISKPLVVRWGELGEATLCKIPKRAFKGAVRVCVQFEHEMCILLNYLLTESLLHHPLPLSFLSYEQLRALLQIYMQSVGDNNIGDIGDVENIRLRVIEWIGGRLESEGDREEAKSLLEVIKGEMNRGEMERVWERARCIEDSLPGARRRLLSFLHSYFTPLGGMPTHPPSPHHILHPLDNLLYHPSGIVDEQNREYNDELSHTPDNFFLHPSSNPSNPPSNNSEKEYYVHQRRLSGEVDNKHGEANRDAPHSPYPPRSASCMSNIISTPSNEVLSELVQMLNRKDKEISKLRGLLEKQKLDSKIANCILESPGCYSRCIPNQHLRKTGSLTAAMRSLKGEAYDEGSQGTLGTLHHSGYSGYSPVLEHLKENKVLFEELDGVLASPISVQLHGPHHRGDHRDHRGEHSEYSEYKEHKNTLVADRVGMPIPVPVPVPVHVPVPIPIPAISPISASSSSKCHSHNIRMEKKGENLSTTTLTNGGGGEEEFFTISSMQDQIASFLKKDSVTMPPSPRILNALSPGYPPKPNHRKTASNIIPSSQSRPLDKNMLKHMQIHQIIRAIENNPPMPNRTASTTTYSTNKSGATSRRSANRGRTPNARIKLHNLL